MGATYNSRDTFAASAAGGIKPLGSGTGRIGAGTASGVWLIWLAAAIWLTKPGFVWQVKYFHSPGPVFFRLLVILLALSPLAFWGYQRLRRGAWWRWEFALLAAMPLAAAIVYEVRAAAVTLAVVLAGFALGRRLRRLFKIPAEGAIEDIALSCGLGLGAFHCGLFVLGLAGWYTVPVFLACLALSLFAGRGEIPELWRALARLHHAWGNAEELQGWPGALVAVFGAAFIAFTLMVALAPSLAYDVLRVHLPLAHVYAAQHALRTPAYLSYGYFPQGVETLMTFGYVLAGDAAAQMLPPVYFALAMLMAFRIGRMCGLGRFAALLGTMFAAATPLIHWTGSVAKNDLALAFFELAALHAYLRWRESGEFRSVLAGAFFVAMGAGIKHSVLYAVPPLALLYAYAAFRQPRPVRSLAKLAALFLVFGTFWPARAWLLMGSPAYPFSAEAAVSAHGAAHWWDVIVRCVRLPWDIHFHGRQYFESPLDHPMGIALLLFVPLWALVQRQRNRAERACGFFCALYLAYWAVVQGIPRFAIAPILILQVLTAGRLVLFSRLVRPAVRFSLYAAAAYALLFGMLGAAIVEVNAPQLRYFARRIGKTEYLREALLPYRAVEFARSVARPHDAILSVDTCPFVYAPNPDSFDCAWTSESTYGSLDAQLLHRSYRILILPLALARAAPGGWEQKYTDESYCVYVRKQPG